MGVELVEGPDLFVEDGYLFMRTTQGRERLDVLYRRIDDAYLDPLTFIPQSSLGVPGLMDLYRAGRVTIVNAPGVGIADDKAVYAYVPEIIQFYTGQRPILQNVPTWRCSDPKELSYVLEHLSELVVKEVHGLAVMGCWSVPRQAAARSSTSAKSSRRAPRTTLPSLRLRSQPVRR